MNIFSQKRVIPSDHRLIPVDRKSIVILLWALGFQAVHSGYEGEAMYVFFDSQDIIAKIDESQLEIPPLPFAAEGAKRIVQLNKQVEVLQTTVEQVISAYLNNVPIFIEWHKAVSAEETWAGDLSQMRNHKRSARQSS